MACRLSAPSHHLNQGWDSVNSNIGSKLEWNLQRSSYIFIHENAFKNFVCEMASISSRSKWARGVSVAQRVSLKCGYLALHVSLHWSQLRPPLTHWGLVTHICVSKLTIIGSDNGLSPGRRQAIIWTKAGILLIGPLRTNFSEILLEIYIFSSLKMHLKMCPEDGGHFVSASMW